MNVLLLDTAFAAVPIYDGLIAAGYDVWVMGSRPADALALRAGARWVHQDYSDVGEVRAHVARLGIDYVVPGCTDVSITTCVELRHNPDFVDTPEVNALLANKAEFRRLCEVLDLAAPRTLQKTDFPRLGRFICKPVDAFSGRGITVFDGRDLEALHKSMALARAESGSGEVLIESFAEGQLYSCSAFIEDQRLTDAFYVIEGASANPYAVDTSHVVWDLEPRCIAALHDSLHRLCSALDLKDGLLHTQFIVEGHTPYIVEIARRCPGDLYSLLIEYSTGFPYAAKYASYFTGRRLSAHAQQPRHVLRHTVASRDHALFAGLTFPMPIPVRAYFPILPIGQPLLAQQRSRAGILFVEVASAQDLRDAYARFMCRGAYDAAW